MVFIISLSVLFVLLIIILYTLLPRLVKSERQRIYSQVDEMTACLRVQLDRVEAQQRTVTENIVTLKSYALDKTIRSGGEMPDESGLLRNFFNALASELGERAGGRVWIVEETGQIVGETARRSHSPTTESVDLPMAVPLRSLLAQLARGTRQARFRTASGEHTLIAHPVPDTRWLLGIDIPTRHLGERVCILHYPWPLATLVLVSTLTLVRCLRQHIHRLNEELPAVVHQQSVLTGEPITQLPVMLEQIGEKARIIASAAVSIAGENERLLAEPEEGTDHAQALALRAATVVRVMNILQDSALEIADNAALLVQLASRVYSYAVQDKESLFAAEARTLAQRCARSSKELRALVTDALMQAQNEPQRGNQRIKVLTEELFAVARPLARQEP